MAANRAPSGGENDRRDVIVVEALATVGMLILLWVGVAALGLAVAVVVALLVSSQARSGWKACRRLRGWLSHVRHRDEQEPRAP